MVLTGPIFIAARPGRHLSGCAARGVDEARCRAHHAGGRHRWSADAPSPNEVVAARGGCLWSDCSHRPLWKSVRGQNACRPAAA